MHLPQVFAYASRTLLLQRNKSYSREWWNPGRIRVQLKREDQSLVNPAVTNSKLFAGCAAVANDYYLFSRIGKVLWQEVCQKVKEIRSKGSASGEQSSAGGGGKKKKKR